MDEQVISATSSAQQAMLQQELEDGGGAAVTDYSSIPLPQRLSSKAWQERASAFAELAERLRECAEEPSKFEQVTQSTSSDWTSVMKKAVVDTNAAAQEKAIEMLCELLRVCPVE
jgi:thioredoxin-like negative regulator of GroEL